MSVVVVVAQVADRRRVVEDLMLLDAFVLGLGIGGYGTYELLPADPRAKPRTVLGARAWPGGFVLGVHGRL